MRPAEAADAARPAWAIAPPPLFPLADPVLGTLPGFRPLDPADWLTRGADAAAQAAERMALLSGRPEEVVAVTPAGEAPLEELAARVRAAAGAAPALAEVPPAPGAAPAVRLAMALSAAAVEDWVLLTQDRHSGCWEMAAGIVCFPAHWRLRDKIGLPVAAVHAPVPQYDADLSVRVDRVLDRLRPGGPGVARANWGLDPGRGLHAPPGAPLPWAAAGPFLRVERQSLLKLPGTGAIAFGIRTALTPLADLSDAQAAILLRALRALPPEVRAYKFAPAAYDAALACLDR